MRFRLEAAPGELDQKGDALIKALIRQLAHQAPELVERLEKALPPPEQTLKYPALQGLADVTREQYSRALEAMVRDIGKVLDRSTKPGARYLDTTEKSEDDADRYGLQKAGGPFIGPRGGKWADAKHTTPWHEPEAAQQGGKYHYGATMRPVSHANVPKGADHRPHEAFRHGVAVYDRPLTHEEIESYELTPILASEATGQRVARTLDDLHEYADEYRKLLEEDPKIVEVTVRQSLERQGPGHFDMNAAVQKVVADLKAGGATKPLQVKIHPKIAGQNGAAEQYHVVEEKGDQVKLSRHPGGHGPWMPKESVKHFVNDLAGKVDLPKSGRSEIDAVLGYDDATFLGKGDDGLAFKVGDKVVKVSTTVPFQPENPGHRTPEAAADMLKRQVETGNKLADQGVKGVQRSEFVRHGDKGFQIKPWVEIPDKFTAAQLDKIQDTLIAIHKTGHALHDDVQAGLDAQGEPVMFDVGKASPIENPEGKGIFSDVADDMDRLKRLYQASGVPFARKDVDEGQKAWDKAIESVKRTKGKGGPKGFAKLQLDIAAKKRREVAVATLKGKALADALEDIDIAVEDELVGWPDDLKKADDQYDLKKAGGPFIGPRGGKWADAAHTIPWHQGTAGAVKIGRRVNEHPEPDWAKGKGKWRSEAYSFASDPGAKPLRTIGLDALPEGWGALGAYDVRDAIRTKLGKLEVPPGHQVVYRVGAGPKSLERRNAGNLEAVTDFLMGQEEKGIQYGDKITAYAVRLPQEFERYRELTGGKSRMGKSAVGDEPDKAPDTDPAYDHTKEIADRDGDLYQRVKGLVLRRTEYATEDFEEGGPLYGYSNNELLGLLRGKDKDLEKAGPYIGPRGGKWADPLHTVHWVESVGGKVRPHETDASKVVLKVPHQHAKQLEQIREAHGITDEIKVGGKYTVLAVPKAVATKIPTPAGPEKVKAPPKKSGTSGLPPYAKSGWKPHETVEEAKSWAQSRGIAVGYHDLATANQLNEAISEQHPMVVQHAEFLGTPQQLRVWALDHPEVVERAKSGAKHPVDLLKFSLGGSAIAIAAPTTKKPYTKSVVVVADSWGTAEQYDKKAKAFKSGFTLGNELRDTVRHEFGHVEGFIFRHLHPSPGGPSVWEVWKKHAVAQLKQNAKQVMADVSEYGATNPHECWAEVSVMRRRGMALAPWIQEAVDAMKIDTVPWDQMGKVTP